MPAHLHNQRDYDHLKEKEPDTKNMSGRLQWLIWKKHYGPMSINEHLELTRLETEHKQRLKSLQRAREART